MVQDEPQESLYDFLYKDSERIASYYAQLFSGRLTSSERTHSVVKKEAKTAKLGISATGGELATSSENQASQRLTVDPHDLVTTDVFTHLMESQRIHTGDAASAPHGSILLAQGNVTFVETSMFDLARITFDSAVAAEKSKPKPQRDEELIHALPLIKSLLAKISIPSAFIMHTSDNKEISGTIRDDGMVEPISSYYYRHGFSGLDGVYLLGIKEIPSEPWPMDESMFFGAARNAAQALSGILFPSSAMRVTPIALFRKLY